MPMEGLCRFQTMLLKRNCSVIARNLKLILQRRLCLNANSNRANVVSNCQGLPCFNLVMQFRNNLSDSSVIFYLSKRELVMKSSVSHSVTNLLSDGVPNDGMNKRCQLSLKMKKNSNPGTVSPCRCICSSSVTRFWGEDRIKSSRNQITVREELFEKMENRNKKDFLIALELFKENKIRRGQIEFIYTAMKHMEDFGVEDDLETYKAVMEVFPKGKMIAENIIQAEFQHFPRHQQCATDLLDKMEENGVCPDLEMREIIVNTFGSRSHVFRKLARMLYWLPKFKHMSPFPLPERLPKQALELAKIALKQITSVDLQTVLSTFEAKELEGSLDHTWIVSAQSPTQKRLISELPMDLAIYIEGPFYIWLRLYCISYFVLRAEPKPILQKLDLDPDDVSNLESEILNPVTKLNTPLPRSVHEQDDGVFLGVCATGTSSRDSLLSWIRFLHKTNPKLKDIPVLFTLRAPVKDLVTVNEGVKEQTKLTQNDAVADSASGLVDNDKTIT